MLLSCNLTKRFFLVFHFIQPSVNSDLCILTQKIGRMLLIGLNRPEKGNLINRTIASTLNDVLYNQFDKDDNIVGGVLYGEGKDFCLGLDVEELMSYIKQNPTCDDVSLNRLYSCLSMDPTKMTFSKPLIAAITGKAIGAGLELALACDLRVAEIDSTLSLHKRKHCIPMMNMGTIRLPALIGLSRCFDMVLTGRELRANEALEFGLVNRVTPTGTAIGVAVKMIDAICRLPGLSALHSDRSSLLRTTSQSFMNSELTKLEFTEALNAFKNEGMKE
ncbi:enoyl-CoA hydratase/isomerase YngF [Schistosoma japonicum]|nr:enoyl-CoA hydratase/isomerase YngF [Schistosoma japonicum]